MSNGIIPIIRKSLLTVLESNESFETSNFIFGTDICHQFSFQITRNVAKDVTKAITSSFGVQSD